MIRTLAVAAAAILAGASLTGCSLEACVPAETVRITIQDTVYRLPAAFQPTILSGNDRFPTQDRIRDGRRIREYCQKPEDPPFVADIFFLTQRSLDRIAAQKPEFSRLRGLEGVAISYAPASRHPAANPSGSLVSGGLFRRVDHQGNFELFSTEPLLFEGHVKARCGPAPTRDPSFSCTIWGQVTPGTLINVHLVDTTHPFNDWPRTLAQVERLIRSFARS